MAPQREQVVGCADRRERRAGGDQRIDTQCAALLVEAGAHDEARVGSDPGGGEATPIPLKSFMRDVQRRGTGEERDPAMPQVRQGNDDALHRGRIVNADLGVTKRMW